MSSFVVINLADPSGMGAISSLKLGVTAKRTRTGLKRKLYGNHSVPQFDCFAMLAADQAGTLSRTDPEVVALRNACRQAKKIYLATHGTPSDVDHCFAAAAGGAPLATAAQLAQFMLLALPMRTEKYDIALVMCYGARTSTYLSANLNHQGAVALNDLRTSFAYKLYRTLCRARPCRMTARTGAVAFDSTTGRSSVEDELAIDARVAKENFLRQDHIVPTTNEWRAARVDRARYETTLNLPNNTPLDQRPTEQFNRLNEAFKNNPGRVATNDEERKIKAYQEMMRTKEGFQQVQDANPDRIKYGKVVYEYTAGTLTVTNKYGDVANGGVAANTVLYQGPIV